MKKLYNNIVTRLKHSVATKTSEELVNKCADVILSDIIDSELTVRQQSDVIFLVVKKLSNFRQTQIEETQQRLAILEEDYAKLNK